MKNISLKVNIQRFYDWQPCNRDDPQALISQQGDVKKRVIKDYPSYTTVSIQGQEIENLMDSKNITKGEAVAWLLQNLVMPQHANWEWINSFECPDDTDIENYLNTTFGKQ